MLGGKAETKPSAAGTGTEKCVPVWTDSAGTLGNSGMYQKGSNIGIGTKSAADPLDVVGGSVRFSNPSGTTTMIVSGSATSGRMGQDAYAKAHPLEVEVDKPGKERGDYIHPELYGQPKEKGIDWARHPQQMRQLESGTKVLKPAGRGVRP